MRRINVNGEKVSIGIDVHKKHYTVSCVVKGVLVQRATMPAEPEGLVKYIVSRFEGAQVQTAYEAGFSGFVLHRALTAGGIKNIVVHAGSIEVAARDRVKNDRRDSLKIALQLEGGRLKGIRVPTIEEEAKRLLHRTRGQLVRKRTQVNNQIKMRLYQFGVPVPKTVNKRTIAGILTVEGLQSELRIALQTLLRIWTGVDDEICRIEKEQAKQAKRDPASKIYLSIPGYGFQTVRIISTELGTMEQFSNERKLFSFVGFTPTEHSSGETERRGGISRQGSARLRGVLVEAAWNAVRYDPYWRSKYLHLAMRIGGKRAIVAIARRLIGVARALIRKGELYQKFEVKAAA